MVFVVHRDELFRFCLQLLCGCSTELGHSTVVGLAVFLDRLIIVCDR